MWLLQNLVSGWVQTALAIVFGIAVAYLKQQGNVLVDPLLYGVAASVMLLMAFASIRVSIHHRIEQRVTTKNVESRVRQWLDNFGARVKRLGDTKTHFAYEVTTPNGNKAMLVSRLMEKPNYLHLEAGVSPWPQVTGAMERAPKQDTERLLSAIRLDLYDAQLTGFIGAVLPLVHISMNIDLPITPTMAEHDFTKAVTHLECVISMIAERLSRFSIEHQEMSDGTPV